MKKKKKRPRPPQKAIDQGTKNLTEFWKNLTPEGRKEMSAKLSESQKRFWANMSVAQERKFRLKKGRLARIAFNKKTKEEQRKQMEGAWRKRGLIP